MIASLGECCLGLVVTVDDVRREIGPVFKRLRPAPKGSDSAAFSVTQQKRERPSRFSGRAFYFRKDTVDAP